MLGWRDNRAAGAAEELRRRVDPAAVHARTGQHLHPSFWPAKLLWLAQAQPEVFAAAARFVSVADYVYAELLGVAEPVTSMSIASSTGLLDVGTCSWDAELLELVGVEERRLPRIGDEPHGRWYPALFDGACSNLGAGCTGRGRAALMVGTSAALRVLYETEEPSPKPGLFLYRLDERRVVEGGALSDGGNLNDWLERTLAAPAGSLAGRGPDDHGLTFLPFLGGERSTGWDPTATGAVTGLTFATTPLDLRQAALEGVAFRIAAVADRLPEIDAVVATGGGPPARPGLDPDHGGRARAARRRVRRRGGLAARGGGYDTGTTWIPGGRRAARKRVRAPRRPGRRISFSTGEAAAALRGAPWRRLTSNSCPSTPSARSRWMRCSRRTPAIPARRWRSLRSRISSTAR